MGKVEKIEHAIAHLSPPELATLRSWFFQFDADAWDQQIAADIQAGKLDALAETALQSVRTGEATEF